MAWINFVPFGDNGDVLMGQNETQTIDIYTAPADTRVIIKQFQMYFSSIVGNPTIIVKISGRKVFETPIILAEDHANLTTFPPTGNSADNTMVNIENLVLMPAETIHLNEDGAGINEVQVEWVLGVIEVNE